MRIRTLAQRRLYGIAQRALTTALVAALVVLAVAPAIAQSVSPAAQAETIQGALFDAQMSLVRDPQRAAAALEVAQGEYASMSASLPTTARGAIENALVDASEALQRGDAPAFAVARVQVRTGLLLASARAAEAAVAAGDATQAAKWLLLREFRQATRFARPGTDATLAVAALEAGQVDAATALAALRADLWDGYQARLNEALLDLADAEAAAYDVRRAETATLAQGYFQILAPAYAEQRGQRAADEASRTFALLVENAAKGESVATLLPQVESLLDGFRAAPLSPAERNRRAAQLLRFLPLVAVEYGRGVRNGMVTMDLEVREAISFAEAAAAAFADLESLLSALDAERTADAALQLHDLNGLLADAASNRMVAAPSHVQSKVDDLSASLAGLLPAEWQAHNTEADFDVVRAALDQMEQAARSGEYGLAESARLDAYATLESGPEARLTAFAPQFVPVIEELFWQGRAGQAGLAQLLARGAPVEEIVATRGELQTQLTQAEAAIGGQMAPQAVASNAALIVFREGLEAVLILASLLASLRIGQGRRMRLPLWIGVVAALAVTVVTWFLARGALTSLARYGERLEAVVSVIAVAMLLLILNWFFHDVYWKDWMAGFHQRKKRILTGHSSQWLGLAVLGFTSIYREGFETVIFLQALVLEAGTPSVMLGVTAGIAATVLLGLAVFGLQARLPHKKMLVVTGVLIGAVLLQMVGNMAHTFQVVGWLPTHPIRWLSLPYWMGMWFGIYPTWEGIGLQVFAAAFTIGSYIAAERLQGHKVRFWPQRRRPRPASASAKHLNHMQPLSVEKFDS